MMMRPLLVAHCRCIPEAHPTELDSSRVAFAKRHRAGSPGAAPLLRRTQAHPRGPGQGARAERADAQQAVARAAEEVAAWQQRIADLDQRLVELRALPRIHDQLEDDLIAAAVLDAALAQVARRRGAGGRVRPTPNRQGVTFE